jgi:hypothetical protein
VDVVDRWSLFKGHLCNESFNWDLQTMVVTDRWSLLGGGCWLRFDFILCFWSSSKHTLTQWFPNFFGVRRTKKFKVLREAQNISLYCNPRTTWADLEKQTWGITSLTHHKIIYCCHIRSIFCLSRC